MGRRIAGGGGFFGAMPAATSHSAAPCAVRLLGLLGGIVELQDGDGLHDLGVECLRRLEQVEQLAVVHLEEHASDLAGELRLDRRDEREEAFAQKLLLLLGRRRLCVRRRQD